jgi:uncharacterized protein (TIGR02145 family)
MAKNIFKSISFILLLAWIHVVSAQSITTALTNNTGSSVIVFSFQNNNNYPVRITGIGSVGGAANTSTCHLYVKQAVYNEAPGAVGTNGVTLTNGWTHVATNPSLSLLANTTTNVAQPFINGMSYQVPGNTQVRFALQLGTGSNLQTFTSITGSLRFSNVGTQQTTWSQDGCDIKVGEGHGYGGIRSSPTSTPRGFIGYLTFMPLISHATEVSSDADTICSGNEVSVSASIVQNQLWPTGYVHCNPSSPTAIVDVFNPVTGATWMDRNLGATRVAISSTDDQAKGSLFQWGRFADGHQCWKRYFSEGITTSSSTAVGATSSTDTPPHGQFILLNMSPYDWRSPQNDNLWQGANGINNPCPNGYRLPTQTELQAERSSWTEAPINSTSSSSGAYNSPLRLIRSGHRSYDEGSLINNGIHGRYWTSNLNSTNNRPIYLFFDSSAASTSTMSRGNGASVRCIKNL